MNRKEMLDEIVEYFNGEQWMETIRLWKQTEEPVYHVHVFVDTCIQYKVLEKIMLKSMEKHGLVLDRKIDYVGNPGKGALHGVHPLKDGFAPLTDWFFAYSKDCYLKPSDPSQGEGGKNLIWWGKEYMDQWFSQFDFKCVGYDEECEIQKYFKSYQWKKLGYYIPRFRELGISHLHCNVEINFDPKVLDMFARREMEKMGWVIANATPCVYKVNGQYRGKITYSMAYPQEVFDIAWKYNEEVVIRPSTEAFVFPEDPWFDIIYDDAFDETAVRAGEYYELTDEELTYVYDNLK